MILNRHSRMLSAGMQRLYLKSHWAPDYGPRGRHIFMVSLAMFLTACRPAPTSETPAPESGPTPSQVIQKFELQDMRDGVKTMTLISTVARLYENEQNADKPYADVETPEILFYQKGVLDKPSSRLNAPKGRVYMSSHEVEAWGGVTVINAEGATLRTERLRYDPNVRKILSDDAVELERPGAITRGVGLESDPELKRVRIRNQKAVINSK